MNVNSKNVLKTDVMRKISLTPIPMCVNSKGTIDYSWLLLESPPALKPVKKFCQNAKDIKEILFAGSYHIILRKKNGDIYSTLDGYKTVNLNNIKDCTVIKGYEQFERSVYETLCTTILVGVTVQGKVCVEATVLGKPADIQRLKAATETWNDIIDVGINASMVVGLTKDGSLRFAPASFSSQYPELESKNEMSCYDKNIIAIDQWHINTYQKQLPLATLYNDGTVQVYNAPSLSFKNNVQKLRGVVAIAFGGTAKLSILKFRPSCLYALCENGRLFKVNDSSCEVIMDDCVAFTTSYGLDKAGILIAVNKLGRICNPDPAYQPTILMHRLKDIDKWCVDV